MSKLSTETEGMVSAVYSKAYNQGIDHAIEVVKKVFEVMGGSIQELNLSTEIVSELYKLKYNG